MTRRKYHRRNRALKTVSASGICRQPGRGDAVMPGAVQAGCGTAPVAMAAAERRFSPARQPMDTAASPIM